MADSNAVRSRRKRQHAQGDHSACLPGRCRDARDRSNIVELPAVSGGNLDPDAAMRELAAQLAAAYARDPANAPLARELRSTLLALSPRREDAVQLEMERFIADLSKPVYPGDDDCA